MNENQVLELKNTMTEIKNSLEAFNIRLTEQSTSEHEKWSIEIQSEEQSILKV